MRLTALLLAEAEATYTITERLMRLVGDSELQWKPPAGRNWMTMGQLLLHCASYGCGKAVCGFVTDDWGAILEEAGEPDHVPPASDLPSVATVDEALELLAADRALTMRCIRATDDAELLGRTVTAPWGGPALPLVQQLLHMIAHLTQHKGQLFYYLKLMGKGVGTADLWGA
jgi:uncharacterized damage-inducible protein DinB